MQFSNSGTKQGLIEDIDFLCGSNSSSYALADKTRNLNQAYQDVTRLIWEVEDDWQYDDSNATDIPVAYGTLVHSQQNYEFPTDAQRVRRIEIKDSNSNWVKLVNKDYRDVDIALPEFQSDAGLPMFYDMIGRSIFLYPTPSSAYCTLASGMAVYVDRDVTLFTTASTTASPGFAPQFHRILSLQASLDFEKDVNQRQLWLVEKSNLVEGLRRFYGSRETERRSEIRPANKKHFRQYE